MTQHDKNPSDPLKTMKAGVMTSIGTIEILDRPVPPVGPTDALIKVQSVGVCGSDLHYFESGRIGDNIAECPFILGHEASGEVVAIGSEVTNLKIGDRVALEPNITCGVCEFCRSGKYNLCPDVEFFAAPPTDGVLQEYVAHPALLCFKLADSMTYLDGAMIEPLSVGLHAARQGKAALGQSAVITGTGCIGLMSVLVLKAMGLSKIIVTDVLDKRLEKARELGATVINAAKEDVVAGVLKATDGRGVDLVIETAGLAQTTNEAIDYTKKGGCIVLVGYSKEGHRDLAVERAMDKELSFNTVFRYRHTYADAIEAVGSGLIDVSQIVSTVFDFSEVQKAFSLSLEDKENIVKAAIKM